MTLYLPVADVVALLARFRGNDFAVCGERDRRPVSVGRERYFLRPSLGNALPRTSEDFVEASNRSQTWYLRSLSGAMDDSEVVVAATPPGAKMVASGVAAEPSLWRAHTAHDSLGLRVIGSIRAPCKSSTGSAARDLGLLSAVPQVPTLVERADFHSRRQIVIAGHSAAGEDGWSPAGRRTNRRRHRLR